MKVSIIETSHATIVKVELEHILGYSGTDFQEAVLNSVKGEKKYTIVDLSKVTFISSSGIGMLMYGFTTAQKNKKEFRICGCSQKLLDSFAQTKLDTVFKIYDSVEEAIKDF